MARVSTGTPSAYQMDMANRDRQHGRAHLSPHLLQGEPAATYYGQPWPRQPIPVFCDGWQSDTMQLERHGYQVLHQYDVTRMAHLIVLGKAGAQSMIMIEDFRYEDQMHDIARGHRKLEFHGELISRMHVDKEVQVRGFRAVDMSDAFYCEHEAMMDIPGRRSFSPSELFPQSKKGTDGIIVLPDNQTVTEVLDLLLEKQAPRQAEIKTNQTRRKHAEIITLEDAA